jgi:hypothetical protein
MIRFVSNTIDQNRFISFTIDDNRSKVLTKVIIQLRRFSPQALYFFLLYFLDKV